MNINLHPATIKLLKGKGIKQIERHLDFHNDDVLEFDLDKLTAKELSAVKDALGKTAAGPDSTEQRSAVRSIGIIAAVADADNAPGDKKVAKLELLATLLRSYIRTANGYRVYKKADDDDAFFLPHIVTKVTYHPPERSRSGDTSPAHVLMQLAHYRNGSVCKDTHAFYSHHTRQKTVAQIFHAAGYVLANDDLDKTYENDLKLFRETEHLVGVQFLAAGIASTGRHRWDQFSLLVDGQRSRAVVEERTDDNGKKTKEAAVVDMAWWNNAKGVRDEDDLDDDLDDAGTTDDDGVPPLHPYVYCFLLARHETADVHVRNMNRYVYDKKMGDKLVLPQETKQLVELLLEDSAAKFQDIIRGKAGGSIILCTGAPGTGKTLTAEVYAEVMERPLYVVQSSQLGTEPEGLEKHLRDVLDRATRWGAILLIDEADVYIHERGADVNQNAIVGVFLRVLEYYKGILFLTTNRECIVDDAIESRCTAQVAYGVPSVPDQVRIWKLLRDLSKVAVSDATIEQVAKANPRLSGRDVKNLLKLAQLVSLRRGKPVDAKTIEHVMKFKPTRTAGGPGGQE